MPLLLRVRLLSTHCNSIPGLVLSDVAVAAPQYVVPLLAAAPLPQLIPAGDQMLWHQCITTAQFIIGQQAVGMLVTHLYYAEKNKARMHSQQLELQLTATLNRLCS